jgi:glyoxylase-like metal-dependent hydrolase (beta-lactamase superfamily II)
MRKTMNHLLAGFLYVLLSTPAVAFEPRVEPVTEGVYALVGEIGPRSRDNHGLNNTLGFVVTDEGVLLVGSGTTAAAARQIEQAVARVTDRPIRWVVNIGVQDHHWMGNRYFTDKGARLYALGHTAEGQKSQVEAHLRRLRAVLGEAADRLKPQWTDHPIEGDRKSLRLGGRTFELIWPGGGHFPGDAVLWMPDRKVVFTGDYVFNDRMLGIQPESRVVDWRRSFHRIEALQPKWVVPGHGHPGSLDKARRDTGDYLDWLVARVGQALEDWKELDETVDELSDAPQFRHLKFYGSWHRRNINRCYLQLEAAS